MITEADILSQVIEHGRPGFTPEAVRAILALRFNPAATKRMNDLAEKNRTVALAEEEQAELEKYLRVGNFLNLVQAHARLTVA
jgi:hypothetical protein